MFQNVNNAHTQPHTTHTATTQFRQNSRLNHISYRLIAKIESEYLPLQSKIPQFRCLKFCELPVIILPSKYPQYTIYGHYMDDCQNTFLDLCDFSEPPFIPTNNSRTAAHSITNTTDIMGPKQSTTFNLKKYNETDIVSVTESLTNMKLPNIHCYESQKELHSLHFISRGNVKISFRSLKSVNQNVINSRENSDPLLNLQGNQDCYDISQSWLSHGMSQESYVSQNQGNDRSFLCAGDICDFLIDIDNQSPYSICKVTVEWKVDVFMDLTHEMINNDNSSSGNNNSNVKKINLHSFNQICDTKDKTMIHANTLQKVTLSMRIPRYMPCVTTNKRSSHIEVIQSLKVTVKFLKNRYYPIIFDIPAQYFHYLPNIAKYLFDQKHTQYKLTVLNQNTAAAYSQKRRRTYQMTSISTDEPMKDIVCA